MQRAEFETKLNRVCLHIYKEEHYEEDYQMPMLRQNHLDGILKVEGCEVDGKARYTYEVSGLVSMKAMYENTCIKKREIEAVITRILEVTETLQRYMLNPNCLVLKPEYIFFKEGRWFFCYFPGMEEDLCKLFHELTEYFVKMLDYDDTEGIFLAYELHKATLQEHYDLELIMKECRGRESERKKQIKEKPRVVKNKSGDMRNVHKKTGSEDGGYKKEEGSGYIYGTQRNEENRYKKPVNVETGSGKPERTDYTYGNEEHAGYHYGDRENAGYQYGKQSNTEYERTNYGNIFSVVDEDEDEAKANSNYPDDGKSDQLHTAESIREESGGGWWKSWRKAANGIRRKRWGSWDDLILETDGQEDES